MKHYTTLLVLFLYSVQMQAQMIDRAGEQAASLAAQKFLGQQGATVGGGDPTPEAITERFFTGAAANDNFGSSVASAGDVNGDGYSDVIIGAFVNDAGGVNAGRTYIFFGGFDINTTPDVILTGPAAGGFFGYSVAGAGDVNGDGYDDVIIGANSNDFGGTDAGRAYIYFGGATMNATADVTLTGTSGEQLGCFVDGGSDLNGDGYSDVIVGALFNSTFGPNAGRAYVYFGGASMNNTPDVILNGEAAGDFFGISVAMAGDVNGDGYGDAIVGANMNDAGPGDDAGRAYVFYGSAAMDSIVDVTLTGNTSTDEFGNSVSGAGDMNGDGYDDVIVGAYHADVGGNNAGRAYIYLGGASMDIFSDLVQTGASANDNFGYSVSGAGDINGDGYDDVVVGAFFNDAGGADAGRAYVYFGGESVDYGVDAIMTGPAAGDLFGNAVAGADDFNGDGYDDILVAAYGNDAGGTDAGRVFFYLNSLIGNDIADLLFVGAAADDDFGNVSGAGDVNGDGYDDIIVGARTNDAGGSDAGRAYIYLGGLGLNATADVIFTGIAAGDLFGNSVAGAGDVNGDGFSDVIVGAPLNDGSAYIFFGGPLLNNIPDVTLIGNGGQFGSLVTSAGDVNGDGYDDVMVASKLSVTNGVYIFLGGVSMDNVADVQFVRGDYFGFAISGAGDVNGDGYDDVIIGAYGDDAGGTDAGRAFIFWGSSGMDNNHDVTLTGTVADDNFGISVSAVGDVNGDGFADVIVGAPGNDAGGTEAGRAYIYYGGPSMNSVVDVTLTGIGELDRFGGSLSSAGDVNNDGYSDVIVGKAFMSNETAGGRADIFFGGASMNNSIDITLTGNAADSCFGMSVASAGDVNGDGNSDVLVGGYYPPLYGTNPGRARLYLSSAPPIVPRIFSLGDVENDQGGYLSLHWIRSGYDARNVSRVTEYLIERSAPPGAGGFVWNQIGTVQAVHNPQYEFFAATPNDSTSNASGTFYFRVTARTSNANEYWHSNIMSGHSVDNLPPGSIPSLSAQVQSGPSVRLNWALNTSDHDLSTYLVYRSTTSGFIPSDLNKIGNSVDTPFVDSSPPVVATLYYKVKARDIHGNEGDSSPEASASFATTQQYSVNASWNLVSVPLSVSDYTKTVLFPAATSDAFAYTGSYVSESVLSNGPAYWLKFSAPQNVSMTGFLRSLDTIAVSLGWNLVGSISSPVAVSSVGSIPGGIVTTAFYGYGASGYSVASTIESGKGYWVKVSQNGSLVLSSTAPDASHRIRIVPTNERPPSPPESIIQNPQSELPTEFSLAQNYPNPFNPLTIINYQLPINNFVTLKVYNLLGEEVATLVDGTQEAGFKSVEWNALNVSTGTYFLKLRAGNFIAVRKMLVAK